MSARRFLPRGLCSGCSCHQACPSRLPLAPGGHRLCRQPSAHHSRKLTPAPSFIFSAPHHNLLTQLEDPPHQDHLLGSGQHLAQGPHLTPANAENVPPKATDFICPDAESAAALLQPRPRAASSTRVKRTQSYPREPSTAWTVFTCSAATCYWWRHAGWCRGRPRPLPSRKSRAADSLGDLSCPYTRVPSA